MRVMIVGSEGQLGLTLGVIKTAGFAVSRYDHEASFNGKT